MLTIIVPGGDGEFWNEETEEFEYHPISDPVELHLEHSLLSVSDWESKWKKSFFTKDEKTLEETIDYIRCMTLGPKVADDVYARLSQKNIDDVIRYIEDPMTATTFGKSRGKGNNRERVTTELVYYWMLTLHIPFECERLHINRLITLINVCSEKNAPQKKRSMREIMRENAARNAARRKKYNSKG